jgi:GDSL-like Lipase/Acylhydrolase family
VTRPMNSARVARGVVVVSLFGAIVCACGQNPGGFARSHAPAGPASVLVALGADGSAGPSLTDLDYQDWTQLFYREAFSERSTLYDFSVPGGTTVEDLEGGELSETVALRPDLVTVSVGLADLFDGTPASVFGQQLSQILARLRAAHTRVLVADLLPVDRFPAYPRCSGRPSSCGLSLFSVPGAAQMAVLITAYDRVIADVASSEAAGLVDLDDAFSSRLAPGGQPGGEPALVDEADLGLTAAGEELVSELFTAAYRKLSG